MFSKKELAVVGNMSFNSMENFMLSWVKHEKKIITSVPDLQLEVLLL